MNVFYHDFIHCAKLIIIIPYVGSGWLDYLPPHSTVHYNLGLNSRFMVRRSLIMLPRNRRRGLPPAIFSLLGSSPIPALVLDYLAIFGHDQPNSVSSLWPRRLCGSLYISSGTISVRIRRRWLFWSRKGRNTVLTTLPVLLATF